MNVLKVSASTHLLLSSTGCGWMLPWSGDHSHEVRFATLGVDTVCARASHHLLRLGAANRYPARRRAVGLGLNATR